MRGMACYRAAIRLEDGRAFRPILTAASDAAAYRKARELANMVYGCETREILLRLIHRRGHPDPGYVIGRAVEWTHVQPWS